MLVQLYGQAKTAPMIHVVLQTSDDPAWISAAKYGTSEQSVWKWRK